MRVTVILACLAAGFSPASGSAQQAEGVNEDLRTVYSGLVVSVAGRTVLVKPAGIVRLTEVTPRPEGGVLHTRTYVQDNTKPPQLFAFTREMLLHEGTLPAGERAAVRAIGLPPRDGHKSGDIRPGDYVYIHCRLIDGIDYCLDVDILRRPGGRVPPAWGDDKREAKDRIDNRRNADQAKEELVVRTATRLLLRIAR